MYLNGRTELLGAKVSGLRAITISTFILAIVINIETVKTKASFFAI